MDNAINFSWTSAKASHAVLLCRMEQGEVKDYSNTLAIDQIFRANAQKHIIVLQPMVVHSHILKWNAKTKINSFQETIRHGWTQVEVHP